MRDSTKALAIFTIAETDVHAGSGATLSHVDLPIQRETHTGFPIIAHSGVKGALREVCRSDLTKAQVAALFGPDMDRGEVAAAPAEGANPEDSKHAGLGLFQEMRVALFPVRSLFGVFAWITCPLVLSRLKRDLDSLRGQVEDKTWESIMAFPGPPSRNPLPSEADATPGPLVKNNKVYLEECDFTVSSGSAKALGEWFSKYALPDDGVYGWWREQMKTNVVVLDNDNFGMFVRLQTVVQPHVKLNEAGTVQFGPWYEEALPADSLLFTTARFPRPLAPAVKEVLKNLDAAQLVAGVFSKNARFQVGGGRSTSMGFMKARVLR